MKKVLKPFVLLLLTVVFYSANAQFPAGGRGQMGGQNMNMGRFYGKLLDSLSNKPLEAASVQLIQNKLDSVTKKRKDVIVAGMLTNKKGEFSLANLSIMASYKLKITASGYKTIEQKVAFTMNMSGGGNGDMNSMLGGVDKDLGNFKLKIDAQQLQNVNLSYCRQASINHEH